MRLAEIYTSCQGEGPNVGKPIQFVRFGGCNFRCPGWPCDTQHAIDPQFSNNWVSTTPYDVFNQLKEWPKRVCITGGEPLIQRSNEMEGFAKILQDEDFEIDLFTNGSRHLPFWTGYPFVRVIMDWKLEGSGEGTTDIEQRVNNLALLQSGDAVKFVVKNEHDLDQARHVYHLHHMDEADYDVYVGAVWGAIQDDEIIGFLKHYCLDWTLNVQIHKHIWEPTRIGV